MYYHIIDNVNFITGHQSKDHTSSEDDNDVTPYSMHGTPKGTTTCITSKTYDKRKNHI